MASLTTRLMPGKKRAPQLLADSTLMRCALDRLGQSMLSPAMAPRLEFRQSLRTELVAQAALRAAAVRPPSRPPKVRKSKGGFRLAALGIGISAAGGGLALAANQVSTPAPPQAPVTHAAAPSVHDGPTTSPSTATVNRAPGVPLPRATATDAQGSAGRASSSAPKASTLRTVSGLSQPSLPATDTPLPGVTTEAIAGAVGTPVADPAPTLPSTSALPDMSFLFSRAGAHWTWPTPPPSDLP
jgi:hypothetical protein